MRKNSFLYYFVIVYVIFTLLQVASYYLIIQTSAKGATAQVTGEVRLCINHPPILNFSCADTVDQDALFYCAIDAADADNHSLEFSSSFITSPELFEISPSGVINYTPNSSFVGNHTYYVTVMDGLDCENSADSIVASLEVVNINDPPVLINTILNQTWEQDSSYSPFDLDLYFYDPDSDPITYTYTLLENIDVTIDSNNIVTFTPIDGWFGTEYIVFFAWDPLYANASSNNITLRVTESEQAEVTPPSSGSSGGGGGGGSAPYCLPKWYCRPWGPCEPDNLRRRECYDLNNCTMEIGKPNLTEPCKFISTCYDGFKGPEEEGVDCGGPCPVCGTCYDNICNNKEDCTLGTAKIPDCGGSCKACPVENKGTCYDSICNNGEDCTYGVTDIPDCGGVCGKCPETERPVLKKIFNWGMIIMLLLILLLVGYIVKKAYPYLVQQAKKRKRKYYESRLMLEAKISESIYESLLNLEKLLGKEDIQKLIILFSEIVRRYFKSLLNLRYEFTNEELVNEINLRGISVTFKNVLTKFFDRSNEIEFSGKSVVVEELRAMISEFKQILSVTSESNFQSSINPEVTQAVATTKAESVFQKISMAESLLFRGEINKAYDLYISIVTIFKELQPKDKQRLQGFISRLYEEIKLSREKYDFEHGKGMV